MTTIEDILSKLNSKTREKVRLASEQADEKQKLPSMGITRALDGGLKYGHQHMFWGNRSSGKSALMLGTIALAQREGKVCALVDAEKSLSKEWAARLGVDVDKLIWLPVKAIEDVANIGVNLIKEGVDVIGVDSMSALLPGSYFDDGEMKELHSTGQIGTFSKEIGKLMAMFNYVNQNTLVMFISQMRNQIGSYGASITPMGGIAAQHYNTTSIKLWTNNSDKELIHGDIHNGDLIFKEPVGKKVTWTIDKDRGAGMGKSDTYDLYYQGKWVGIDNAGETLDLAVLYGKVNKGGAWYHIYGEKFQGKPAAVKHLHENPEVLEKLQGELL